MFIGCFSLIRSTTKKDAEREKMYLFAFMRFHIIQIKKENTD